MSGIRKTSGAANARPVGDAWLRQLRKVAVLLGCIVAFAISTAAKDPSVQLAGYKAVPVHYGPMNKMIIFVRINGQPANLLVDTGSNQLILDAQAAASFGIRPSQRGLRYIRFTQINGRDLPVGFAQNISASSMNFGSTLVTLSDSIHSDRGEAHIDGVLGLDLLLRHKALINCRTKLIFFKVDHTQRINLASIAASEKFVRVPIQREETGVLTVPCSIGAESTRLLIDTGAFVTMFHDSFIRSLGVTAEQTRISARFGPAESKQLTAAKLDNLAIGGFRVRPEKFGVALLPQFALHQGSSKIGGILGIDTLYLCHAIIDLDTMNLFLK